MTEDTSAAVAELELFGAKLLLPPRDAKIYCPHIEWVKKFARYNLATNPFPRREKMDCDDYVIRAVNSATVALNEADLISDCGHSIGMAGITISAFGPGYLGLSNTASGETHMTCIIRTDEREWIFYEPQTGLYDSIRNCLDTRAVASFLWAWV